MSNKNTFEKNGGYFIDGVAYMDCKITGEPVANVSIETKSVIGSRALMGRMFKQFPETSKPTYTPTGRPAGWHFMNEFVDADGNVNTECIPKGCEAVCLVQSTGVWFVGKTQYGVGYKLLQAKIYKSNKLSGYSIVDSEDDAEEEEDVE